MTDLSIFKSAFDALPDRSADQAAALNRFTAQGLPTNRLEEWKYTDLGGLDRAEPAPAAQADLQSWTANDRLIIVNGRVQDCTLDRDQAAAIDMDGSALVALNTAFASEPVSLTLSGSRTLEIIHHVTGAEAKAAHHRLALRVAEGATITIVERFCGDQSAYWQNAVVDLDLAAGAKVRHVRLNNDGTRAVHTSLTRIRLAKDAAYDLTGLTIGGEIARADVHVDAKAEGAHATLNMAQLARPGQSLDLRSYFDHQVPDTTSNQVVRNVLARQGKTAFQGKVHVARDAQRTDAQQSAKSLLLDRTAEANTKPELEIYADDVVCAHGATVGELDAKQLFYLMSRGLGEGEAKALLVEAFIAELFDAVEDETVRNHLLTAARNWLHTAN